MIVKGFISLSAVSDSVQRKQPGRRAQSIPVACTQHTAAVLGDTLSGSGQWSEERT